MPAARIFVFVLLSSFLVSSSAFAQGVGMGPMDDPPESERLPSRIVMMPIIEGDELTLAPTRVNLLGSFDTMVNAGSALLSNAPVLAAFDRALAQWEAFISDPITVNFDVDFRSAYWQHTCYCSTRFLVRTLQRDPRFDRQ